MCLRMVYETKSHGNGRGYPISKGVNQLRKHFRFLGRSDGREAHLLKITGLKASLRKRFPVQWCNLWNSPENLVHHYWCNVCSRFAQLQIWLARNRQKSETQAVPSSPNRSQSVPSPNLSQSAPEISLPRSRGWPTDVHQTLGTAVASQRSYETTAPLIHSLSWIPRYRQCWECCWIAGFCFATWIILRTGHHQVCTCLSFAKMVVHPNHPFLIRCSKLDFPICYIFQSWINYLQDHRFMVDALKVWQLVDSKVKWPTATLTMCWSMLILGMGSQLFGPLNLKVFPDWIDQVFP